MPLTDFEYSVDVGQIKRVTFGILSPQRIKQKSVCEIYKRITNLQNLEGTLMDPRLGPIERGVKCLTCHYTREECPGHFGYLNLVKPVIQIPYYSMVLKLLGCFCNRCSSILIDKYNPTSQKLMDEIHAKSDKGRFAYVDSLMSKSAAKTCHNCGAPQPKYSKDRDGIVRIVGTYDKGKEKEKFVVNPEMIFTIFKNVTDEDIELVGLDPKLSRPEWMIWTIMPIPPPAMRPSVKQDNGKTNDDDLTHKLNDVIKWNALLRQKITEATKQSLIEEMWQLLQYHVSTYIDNEISNLPHAHQRSGRPLKTIRQRIKAKDGRVRGNLMGKRVDGSARSVITADPSLSMDQLGVPRKIAMNLTYPELVTKFNLAQMTQLVRSGPFVYPGAKSFKRLGSKTRINLKYNKQRETIDDLKPGDIVYRHLLDNDWVLFNRQPSLHKMSMMAHRVKVLDGNTFRFNPVDCAPYNGDFDGDRNGLILSPTGGCLIGC